MLAKEDMTRLQFAASDDKSFDLDFARDPLPKT